MGEKIEYHEEENTYGKVTSSNTSHLEADAGFFKVYEEGLRSLCTVTVDFLIIHAH